MMEKILSKDINTTRLSTKFIVVGRSLWVTDVVWGGEILALWFYEVEEVIRHNGNSFLKVNDLLSLFESTLEVSR